ncbi:hypothetical protein ACQHIV_42175 (plasmid) [Kribbella sp. GL6]|uniref:hypothetical protein n=1 Tax=Kribbella sp. GL6 TaxID=3419765 RepID=UPI003D077140
MTKSKSDELRERAARQEALLAARSQPPAAGSGEDQAAATASTPAPQPGQTLRVRPVKVTVELQPIEHQRLTRWAQRFAEELQLPRIAGAEVFRVLLDLMQHDEALAARVGQELARTGGTRRRESRNSATP